MACNKCHLFGENENTLGPDLSKLPEDATNVHLAESILNPAQKIRRGYETVTLLLQDGRSVTGPIAPQAAGSTSEVVVIMG